MIIGTPCSITSYSLLENTVVGDYINTIKMTFLSKFCLQTFFVLQVYKQSKRSFFSRLNCIDICATTVLNQEVG